MDTNWYELICKAGSVANNIFIVTLLLVIAILCMLVVKDLVINIALIVIEAKSNYRTGELK